jgi:hypothetical protein
MEFLTETIASDENRGSIFRMIWNMFLRRFGTYLQVHMALPPKRNQHGCLHDPQNFKFQLLSELYVVHDTKKENYAIRKITKVTDSKHRKRYWRRRKILETLHAYQISYYITSTHETSDVPYNVSFTGLSSCACFNVTVTARLEY